MTNQAEMLEDADLDAFLSDESAATAEDGNNGADESELAQVLSAMDDATRLRVVEAMIFMADAPVPMAKLQQKLGADVDVTLLLAQLQERYSNSGIELAQVGGGYAFRTALDLNPILKGEKGPEVRKPPRAATETLAIVAYHQPVTRAEIEAIRGVQVSRGTLDLLMEAGWIRPGKRRETPGRPVTWLTTPEFLTHFGLSSLRDLPGLEELKAAGMLDSKPVLATLAPEAEFEAGLSSLETQEENDLLPAGDEADDYNVRASMNADDENSDAEADDEAGDESGDEAGDDDSASDDDSDDDADEDLEFDDADSDDDDDFDDDDADEDDDADDEEEARELNPRVVAAAE